MRIVALDLSAKKISFCELSAGRVVKQGTVLGLEGLSDLLGANTPPARVAIESCREAWHVHDELVARGHEVLVVDTTRVGKLGIGRHGRKTDRIDAEVLARALESGHIPVAHVLTPQRREMRMQLSVRKALVETRTQYIASVRGLLRAKGQRLPGCDAGVFVHHWREATLGEEVRKLTAPLIEVLVALEPQLALVEQKIQQLSDGEPVTRLLMTAPGVGVVVAAAFVSVVDEAKRFTKAHHLESYLGLVPSEDSSGGKRRIGAISKAGNSYLRALLVQAAWGILRLRDDTDPLKAWGAALAARRGKRVAVVALARRLAGVLWAMWRDGTVYDPVALAKDSARGARSEAHAAEHRAAQLDRAATKAKIFARRQRPREKEARSA
jgi:transposase